MGCASSEKPKKKHKKGLWSPDEDERLKNYIQKHGHGCWSSVPINAGLQRNGKSCRLRWINYLRPGLKRGAFSIAEQDTIFTLHQILGNKWSQIAQHLPGRSDNEIKNYWHSYLKKRVAAKMAEIQVQDLNNIDYLNGQKKSNKSLESVDQIKIKPSQNEEDQNLNLPKVIFAEWLSLDEDLGNVDQDYIPNLGVGDTLIDDMLPSTFNLDCQIDMYHYNQTFQ